MITHNIMRESYTVGPSITARRSEVVAMPDPSAIVFVVDDDVSVRESLELLIKTAGWKPETFVSAPEFLSRPRATVPCCLVLDVTLPGLNGLELQQQLTQRTEMPIIFITGYGDVPMSVRAMKAGATEFLTKPFKDEVLLDAIRHAIDRSRDALREESEMHVLRTRYASLTPREREVMALVVSGLLNKQVGGELGISEITVKAHRGQLMRKMQADSLAGLVTMAAKLGVPTAPASRSAKRNLDPDDGAAPRRRLDLERAVQLTRAFAHRDQPQAAQQVSIEPYPIVRNRECHHACRSRQADGDAPGPRMLRRVAERFLHDAEQCQRGAAREVAQAVVSVARYRDAATGAELLAVARASPGVIPLPAGSAGAGRATAGGCRRRPRPACRRSCRASVCAAESSGMRRFAVPSIIVIASICCITPSCSSPAIRMRSCSCAFINRSLRAVISRSCFSTMRRRMRWAAQTSVSSMPATSARNHVVW